MSNVVYDNKVLENKLKSLLDTKIDMHNYLTVDRSLAEAAGMKKTINKYQANGNVEDLAMTEGNSGIFEGSFVGEDYVVGVTQGKGVYYDEEAMKDPMIVDTIVKGMAEQMNNDFTRKAIKEMGKANLAISCDFASTTSDYFFEKVVDALALFGEDVEGLSLLINPKHQAWVRKQLKDNLKYSEGFVRTGYIGSVAGVPVVVSNAVSDSAAFIVNKEAVTLFIKKEAEAEQERDADHRKNTLYIRKVALVALTDATKVVALAKGQTTACAITTYTKATNAVEGTCGTDCFKVHVLVGDKAYDAIPANGAWAIETKDALAAGDKINATAYAIGLAPKAATEVTVAE